MNYWLTTHWPPTEDEAWDESILGGVYLRNGREQAGRDLAVKDIVLIYQTKTGRAEVGYVRGSRTIFRPVQGKQGIVAIAEVVGNLREIPGSSPSEYVDGSKIWWRWRADTQLVSTNGFVPLRDVNRVLRYSPNYNLRGLGDHKSGLRKLNEGEFLDLVEVFKKRPRKIAPIRKAKAGGGGVPRGGEVESEKHRTLKNLVASDPSTILGERFLKTVAVEHRFPTGDKADIVLEDVMGRVIGVEIETHIHENQLEGILQAIKYRYMLALTHERRNHETRAFLVAYSIPNRIMAICEQYEVEPFTVDRSSVGAGG